MRRAVFLLAGLITLALLAACGDSPPNVANECEQGGLGGPGCSPTPTVTVSFGTQGTLQVEIANTSAERALGLMNRSSLGADAGMLFVFPADTQASFWMKNTLLPLSIAFVKADGTVVHIEDMQPQTETDHYSTEAYRYAIEANQGWFASHRVAEGDTAQIPSGITGS